MVSAVKVDGERLYKKARRGEDVESHARKITVSRFELQRFEPGETPTATFDITGSGGTYVRTLIHDLGATLGCGAHMAVLRRTEAGGFTEADLVPLDGLEEGDLLPMAEAVRGLPRIEINEQGAKMVSHGRSLSVGDLSTEFVEEGHAAAIVHAGALLAIYRRKQHQLVADKVVS
jgi:tRNA pseudouridine55 synthase